VDEIIYEHASNNIKNLNSLKYGLWTAVIDFLETEKGKIWDVKERFTNNNGLTILERRNNVDNTHTNI
jgi:hypothetical protein